MNRVQNYILLIARLRRLLPADQVEHIAADIRAIAGFSEDELRQAGVGSLVSDTFAEAMPSPSRRNVYSPRTRITERS